MVKVKYATNSPARPRRGKGQPVVYTYGGNTYIRSAPSHNPTFKTYWRWWMRQEFALAARWAKSPEPMAYATAVEMAKNTEFIPRDILMMASMGTYYTVRMPNGQVLEQGRMATSNVQYILDLLDPDPGAIIVRRADSWWAIPPGSAGQVLTVIGNEPGWADGGGGGGGGGKGADLLDVFSGANPYGLAVACVANLVTPWADLTAYAMQAKMTVAAGADYRLGIAPYDPATGKLTAAPTYTVAVAASGTGANQYLNGTFASPLTLTAAQAYMFLIVRTDGGPTPSETYDYIGVEKTGWGYRFGATNTAYQASDPAPSPSTVWTSSGGGAWSCAPLIGPA